MIPWYSSPEATYTHLGMMTVTVVFHLLIRITIRIRHLITSDDEMSANNVEADQTPNRDGETETKQTTNSGSEYEPRSDSESESSNDDECFLLRRVARVPSGV